MILRTVKIPIQIHRKPDSILKFNQWKSSEIKIFLFYISIPIFLKFLPRNYFYYYCAYVFGIRILYEPIHSEVDLNLAKLIINKYVINLEEYFGKYAYNYSAHAHLHLSQQVENHGPLKMSRPIYFRS